MRRHGKSTMPVSCVVRIDAKDDDWPRLSSPAILTAVTHWMTGLFGASASALELVLADAAKRTVVVGCDRFGIEQLRAACVSTTIVAGVPLRLTVTGVQRQAVKRDR
jgi:hypothetical protein